MKRLTLSILLLGLVIAVRADEPARPVPPPQTTGPAVETIVCIRHGEKPKDGLGQLTCRGLNRALALPEVLLAKYGTPQFVFAPSSTQKIDGLIGYSYVRPLMTIEPTAIRCGLPVNAQFGYLEIAGLAKELRKPEYKSATIFIAWEHVLLDQFAKDLVKANGGDPAQVPDWPKEDYDTIFVVKITHTAARPSVTFTIDHEGLDSLSDTCPTAK